MGDEKSERPCVAKRLQSSKKEMFAIYLGTKGPLTRIADAKGRSVNVFFYKDRLLGKWTPKDRFKHAT